MIILTLTLFISIILNLLFSISPLILIILTIICCKFNEKNIRADTFIKRNEIFRLNRRVSFKFFIFQILKYNIFIVLLLLFLSITLLFSVILNNKLVFFMVIISFILISIFFTSNFSTSRYRHIINYFSLALTLLSTFVINLQILFLISILLLALSTLNILSLNLNSTKLLFDVKKNHQINEQNNIIYFTYLRIMRKEKKNIIIYLFLLFLLIICQYKQLYIDYYYYSLLIFYLLDIEILADKSFKHLNKTTARFYIMFNLDMNFINKWCFSIYFSKFCLFSGIYICIFLIELYFNKTDHIINIILIFPLLFIISLFYFLLQKKTIINKKKYNNLLFQYFLFIFIILYIISIEYFLRGLL